jgi:hypothetical protein
MDEVCGRLIEMARAAGGPDNVTVLAARFDGEALPRPSASDKVAYERWRLDEPEPRPEVRGASPPQWSGRSRRVDPARTFFSLMLLLALALGGLVVALQLRRHGGTACTVRGAPGLAIRVDGRDVGVRTRGAASGVALRLPPGRHRVALRQTGGGDQVRTVDVTGPADCHITFEEER